MIPNPTLLIAGGTIGRDVTEVIEAEIERLAHFGLIEGRERFDTFLPEPNGAITEGLRQRLDLNLRRWDVQFRERPSDRQQIDLFFVADLADPEITRAWMTAVIEGIEGFLESIPRLIEGGCDVLLLPILVLPLLRKRGDLEAAVPLLSFRDRRRGCAPIFLIENQSAKFTMRPEEQADLVATFIRLLVFGNLRYHEGLRRIFEHRSGDPFGTFMIESAELPTVEAFAYCADRYACEILARVSPVKTAEGGDLSVTAPSGLSRPDPATLHEALVRQREWGSLEAHLRDFCARLLPEFRFRPVGLLEPRERVAAFYTPHWHEANLERLDTALDRSEYLLIDESIAVVEKRGIATLLDAVRDLAATIDRRIGVREEGAGARKPKEAPEPDEGVHRCRKRVERFAREIAAEKGSAHRRLERFPPRPRWEAYRQGYEELCDAIAAKPRFSTLCFFGLPLAFLTTLFSAPLLAPLFERFSAALGIERSFLSHTAAALLTLLLLGYLGHLVLEWGCAPLYDLIGDGSSLTQRKAPGRLGTILQRSVLSKGGGLLGHIWHRVSFARDLWIIRIEGALERRVLRERDALEHLERSAIRQGEGMRRRLEERGARHLEGGAFDPTGIRLPETTLRRFLCPPRFFPRLYEGDDPPDPIEGEREFRREFFSPQWRHFPPYADPGLLDAFARRPFRSVVTGERFSLDPEIKRHVAAAFETFCNETQRLSLPLEIVEHRDPDGFRGIEVTLIPPAFSSFSERGTAREEISIEEPNRTYRLTVVYDIDEAALPVEGGGETASLPGGARRDAAEGRSAGEGGEIPPAKGGGPIPLRRKES